ncbi:MAG: type I-E CRISPR-associated protein Cas7/Cse4/CasC [Clostridiales bacterium]|nr:type I-E CRISPR-associated protein Cas7/Cse4/CasC [Clostridiales bacterium]
MLYEIHMIKNYPPTNLNRDDSGSPKSCTFGGIRRGRISSQCIKRSWRKSNLYGELLGEQCGIRTRKLPNLIADVLLSRGVNEEAVNAIKEKVAWAATNEWKDPDKKKSESKKGKTKNITEQIIFYSPEEIIAIANLMHSKYENAGSTKKFEELKISVFAKELEPAKIKPITLDMALFGRMVTSNAFRDVEAAMQVAHAISTHAVNQESDYFTAVDDLVNAAGSDDSGAGMIGDVDFNSNCYYHYASIDINQLAENLKYSPNKDELISALIPAIIKLMAFINPSGKQNSFAGNVLPSLMIVEVKGVNIPVSYVNAFAKPARSNYSKDLIADSVEKLVCEIDKTDNSFGITSKRFVFAPGVKADMPQKGEVAETIDSFTSMITAAMQHE